MQEYVDQSLRNLMEETMNDDCKGQFETWNKCLELPTKARIDDCQEDSTQRARSVGSLKSGFMFQNKLSQDVELSKADGKAVELQLPLLKRWADFHFLVLPALMKTYNEFNGKEAPTLYRMHNSDYIESGSPYVGYMEWALVKIRKARIEDKRVSPSLTCQRFEDVTRFELYSMSTSNWLKIFTRTFLFKCDSMRPEYCGMTSVRDCTINTDGCYLCGGFYPKDRALVVPYAYLQTKQIKKSKEISNKYINRLNSDLNAFWAREVELFLPIYKKAITALQQEPEGGQG